MKPEFIQPPTANLSVYSGRSVVAIQAVFGIGGDVTTGILGGIGVIGDYNYEVLSAFSKPSVTIDFDDFR